MNLYIHYKKAPILFLIIGLSLIQFRCTNKMNATRLIQKSIAAHGGKEAWDAISKIEYLKETQLYYPNGAIEKASLQRISHSFDPSSTQIEWGNLDFEYKSIRQNSEIQLFKNESEIFDSIQLDKARKSSDGALYVFWQPYKLLDLSAKTEYQGITKLLDSLPLHTLKVTYPKGEQSDVWHYFFNPNTLKLEATQVNHDGKISLIINESIESKTGLSLNKTRKSYFLDSLGKINYLRAAYTYKIESLTKH